MKRNYLISVAEDGDTKMVRTQSALGFKTLIAAKEARIEEIQNNICCYRKTINGYLDELEGATKGRELQDGVRSYLDAIRDYQRDIVEAVREQMKVRKL